MSCVEFNGTGAIGQRHLSHLPVAIEFSTFPALEVARRGKRMDWRNNLRRLIKERKMTYKDVAVKAKMDIGYVSKILRSVPDPAISKVSNIADALGVTIDELYGSVQKSKLRVTTAPVVGEIAAGFWMDADAWDISKYEDVPSVPTRFDRLKQSAWKVLGTSMDEAGILDGSFVITVPYYAARAAITSGDIVVVEEHDNGRVRRTVKEVAGEPGRFELRPRSSNPAHEPITIPGPDNEPPPGVSVEVVGLVIGSYRPIG